MERILEPLPILLKDELLMVRYLKAHPGNWKATLQQVLDKVGIISYSVASLFFNEYLSGLIAQNKKLPRELPLLFSNDRNDVNYYSEFLKALGMYPLSFSSILAFNIVRLQKRTVPTMCQVNIEKFDVTPHGVVLGFTLGKAEYATTFLSHIFNLIAGTPPEYINKDEVNTKQLIGEETLTETLAFFKPIIKARGTTFVIGE
jgi:hypothetical protein